jgi:hypothetical protein
MTTDELVPVMVPRPLLTHVYGLIAKLHGELTAPVDVPTQHANGDATTSNGWTPSLLRKMLQQSPPAMKDVLRTMAEHPDEWLTTKQLAEAIQNNRNADWMTLAGTMGAFGRRLKNRYGIENPPFEKRYDHEFKGKVYRMSAATSAQVLTVLQEI